MALAKKTTAPRAFPWAWLMAINDAVLGVGVDCVGLECHGYGRKHNVNEEEAVINVLMEVVKPAGAVGIPGVYTDQDPQPPTSSPSRARWR